MRGLPETLLSVALLAGCGPGAGPQPGSGRTEADADAARPPDGSDTGRSSEEAVSPPGEPKQGAGVRARLVEPERFTPGGDLSFALELEGDPHERLAVRLFGSEGVVISRYTEPTVVDLGRSGRARLDFSVEAPESPGCYVFAHVAAEDGRLSELRCVLGDPPPAEDEDVELRPGSGGRGVLIEPAREARSEPPRDDRR